MNRLILIGNGFDIAHGLKTSCADFINWIGWFKHFKEKMDINILTLVTAALALIVGFATLVITFLTYRYYIRSDRKNVRRKLKQKEERLKGLNNLIWGSAFSA